MDIQGWISTVATGVGAAVVAGASARRYWAGREDRQQRAFRAAVAQIVREQTAELIDRQAALLAKQQEHLDRQDRALAELRRTVARIEQQRRRLRERRFPVPIDTTPIS